jgi:uncharacterized protein
MKRLPIFAIFLLTLLGIGGYIFSQSGLLKNENVKQAINSPINNALQNGEDSEGGPEEKQLHPLSIGSLRSGEYPGSDLVIEQTLPAGSNYQRHIASYKSEGLKIYGLLTIPSGEKPASGWPVIIFNHGYIPPTQYRTTERYIAYTDAFSRNGYVLFRPDYRGHGNSEGAAAGGYGSNAYTIDVLNATASVKKLKDVDINRIGMWGHSMGGHITLRNMVAGKDIKAGVIWGGVVASYPDLINRWRRGASPVPGMATPVPSGARRWRQALVDEYGPPEKNPEFWNSISANAYLKDISGPLQLHHGTADTSVPVEFSETLNSQMKAAGKEVELYTYPGDDHDITSSFGTAIQRSVEFFDKYLKN